MDESDLSALGFQSNETGGIYQHGHGYPLTKKLEIQAKFIQLYLEFEKRPTCRELASACKIGKTFASKVINEILCFGGTRDIEKGP